MHIHPAEPKDGIAPLLETSDHLRALAHYVFAFAVMLLYAGQV